MSISSKTLLTLAGLLGLAVSAPASLSRRQHESECAPGTGTWYVCANGYIGCFTYNVCDLPPKPSTTGVPTPTGTAPTTTTSVYDNKHYNLYPTQSASPEDRVPHVDVKWTRSERVEVTQSIVVFPSVPKGAKTCKLMWRQSAPPSGHFFQDVSGVVRITQVPARDFPVGELEDKSQPIAHQTTQHLVEAAAEADTKGATFNFENWEGRPATTHNGPYLDCAEKIVVHLALEEPTEEQWNAAPAKDDPRVFLERSDEDKSGVYLEVTL